MILHFPTSRDSDFVRNLCGSIRGDLRLPVQQNLPAGEDLWPLIESHLPVNFREEAKKCGLIGSHAEVLGTKVRDISEILRLVLMMVGNNFSLRVATATCAAAGILSISPVALHKWMRKIGDYLAWILAQTSKCDSLFEPQRWGGYDVIATDATSVERPGASGTTARVHLALRLSTLRCLEYKVTSDKVGEHLGGFECMGAEQLWIGDRGYTNPPCVERASSVGAAVLIRYNLSSIPLYRTKTSERPMDVVALCRNRAKVGVVQSCEVWVKPKPNVQTGDTVPIAGFLHFRRMAKDKAKQTQAKLRRTRKNAGEPPPSVDVLELAAHHIVFTTAPASRLSGIDCLNLYRLRWQIELHNKREKSIGGLDGLPNFRTDTIDTWICAKLLLTQLAMRITESGSVLQKPPSKPQKKIPGQTHLPPRRKSTPLAGDETGRRYLAPFYFGLVDTASSADSDQSRVHF
jgi:hypothetical protein